MTRGPGPLEDATHSLELQRLRLVAAAGGDAVYDLDLASGRIQWQGGAPPWPGLAGIADMAALERAMPAEDRPGRRAALNSHLRQGAPFDCEYRLRREDGSLCWVRDLGGVVPEADGPPRRLVGCLRPITRHKQREAALEWATRHDELTGHFSRGELRRRLEAALAEVREAGGTAGYLLIGIDHISRITAAFGPEAAEAVTVELGSRLRRWCAEPAIIGRAGGTHFGLLLPGVDTAAMQAMAERILSGIRGAIVETACGPVPVTVSVGAVPLPEAARDAVEGMARAEEALAEAKRRGRDRMVTYDASPDHRRRLRRSREVAHNVLSALRQGRLRLAWQPVAEAKSGRIVQYESLMRMVEDDGTVVVASRFMPMVEQLGMARMIDRHALELSVAELVQAPHLSLAVNVSGLTTADSGWLDLLGSLLRRQPDLADRLTIEVTETSAAHDFDETARFVRRVRDLGCHVALDDFGAGYTSFRHLRALPIDVVKIDGSLIRGLASRPDNERVVRTLADLAHHFALTTVAECVEQPEEARILAAQGISLLQGHYFGSPSFERPWLKRPAAPPARTSGNAAD